MEHNKLRIGAINWDAVLPKDTYFGGYAIKSLANPKYESRLHFTAFKQDGEYQIRYRTGEDYNKELEYAINGGIDFFAYCWYPDTDEKRDIWHETYDYLAPHYHELNYARKLYQKSPLNSKINMCAIVFSISAYAKSDIDSLAHAMKMPYYEKVDGKPLLMVFGGYNKEFTELMRSLLGQKGITPYIALIDSNGLENVNKVCEGIDAITGYGSGSSATSFAELNKLCNTQNHNRANYKMPVIPLMTAGWNPMPRVDSPCPWFSYENAPYAGTPDLCDFQEGFKLLNDFIDKNKEYANTNHAIVFAWNEFEEGGYLCPTINKDGSVNDTVIKNFAKARKAY